MGFTHLQVLQRILICITFHWTVTRLPTLKLVSKAALWIACPWKRFHCYCRFSDTYTLVTSHRMRHEDLYVGAEDHRRVPILNQSLRDHQSARISSGRFMGISFGDNVWEHSKFVASSSLGVGPPGCC